MASLSPASNRVRLPGPVARATTENRRALRDSLIVSLGGQLERVLGTLTALALRWGLDPARLGVYTGLRLYLDNTNRSSLGVSLGAAQEIPILRAAGREDEARRVANVAYTTNTLTCLVYAVLLVAWAMIRIPLVAGDPLAAEWTWGLVAIAGLTLIKRYQDFLIVVLRAHQEFTLTTRLAVLDALVSAGAVATGLWLAGFWGLLAAVGGLLSFNIVYLHARHPLRFAWVWGWPTIVRLMRVGLPILANTAVFGAVLNLDRVLILWCLPADQAAYAAGLYSIALLGTDWSRDLAGRIVTVMYTYFQTTLGRTRDAVAVARQAARVTELQAPILAAGSAVAYLAGPVVLGALVPRYAAGLPALRPLLPGMILLGLAWPARQMLIAIDRPYRLCLMTLLGLGVTAAAGLVGVNRAGIVGVAWGMSAGYAAVYVLTSAVAFAGGLGWRSWFRHQARLGTTTLGYLAAGMLTAHLPLPRLATWPDLAIRLSLLGLAVAPPLWVWGMRHRWGGLFDRPEGAVEIE